MPAAANEHCFSEPHWRVIAQGFETEAWFHDGQAVGTGGIRNPQPIHLAPGQYHYRFASSTTTREQQLGGGWWLDFEHFRLVKTFADQHGYSLREAARLMLALPTDWTRVDLQVKALLVLPLKAYAGEGKPARGADGGADKGTAWIPTQHVRIRQLYIPGLVVRGSRKRAQLFETAFADPPIVERLA